MHCVSFFQSYIWTTVNISNVNQPDMPRLILRRVPVPASSPGSSAKSSSDTPPVFPSSSPFSGLSSPGSPLRQPALAPDGELSTCVVSDIENKVALPDPNSPPCPESLNRRQKRFPAAQQFTSGPEPKWRKKIKAILRVRNKHTRDH